MSSDLWEHSLCGSFEGRHDIHLKAVSEAFLEWFGKADGKLWGQSFLKWSLRINKAPISYRCLIFSVKPDPGYDL